MAIKPILFNTEMVRAILDGRKSCTRRIIKPQPQSRLCYTFAGGDCGTWGYPSKTAHESWGDEYRLPEDITDEELKMKVSEIFFMKISDIAKRTMEPK